MQDTFSRLQLLIGDDGLRRLQSARILLLGVGGVGSWTAETLVRSGIGHLTIVDYDIVKASNLNRQLLALHSTLGRPKTAVMGERLLDINPQLDLEALDLRLTPENIIPLLDSRPWNYVIDAIDERPPKTAALIHCLRQHIPVISSMGAASKRSSEGIAVVDISETSGCHLARLVRKALHREGIESGLPVVFSPALPEHALAAEPDAPGERRPLGTIAYLPAMFGLKCAEHVISALLDN